MCRLITRNFTAVAVTILSLTMVETSLAIDLEAFEFNDSDFTELNAAANSVNGGNNWSDTIASSAVSGGAFFIGKDNDDFSTSHLQIDNITSATSGSRFIVAEIRDWNFVDNVVGEGEELRFAFLNDDTGIDGSTVAAEVRIDRNTTSAEMELRGVAVGIGSANISNRQTLNTTQSSPFTMVLELNKTSNTYEIFYKDGANFSQALGTGSVAPSRDGNSMRMVVNNNFGSDFSEFLQIERVALTDSNPLTDLLTLEIDRDSGVTKLINTSGAAVNNVESISLTSDIGAVDPAGLTSFSGDLAIDQEVTLSIGSGPWIKNNTEDLRFELNFAGGVTRSANVNFTGNNDMRFGLGDLTFDGNLTVDDWTIFIAGAETDLSALSVAQAYQSGDLDGDGVNSIIDFGLFQEAFDAANGVGAFTSMLASVPEPTSAALLMIGALCATTASSRRRGSTSSRRYPLSADKTTKHNLEPEESTTMHVSRILPLSLALAIAVAAVTAQPVRAAIFEEILFDDAAGTAIEALANNANPGNMFDVDADNAGVVTNGLGQLDTNTKNNIAFGTNYLDTAAFTTGRMFGVMELTWDFQSIFDSGEPEQVRLSMVNSDPRSTEITAEFRIERTAAGPVINGQAGPGGSSTDIANVLLNGGSLTQSEKFIAVIDANLDTDVYEILYSSDAGASFLSAGTGMMDPTRGIESLRMALNNDLVDDNILIDRLYLTDVSPITSIDALTLEVNTVTGKIDIKNETTTPFDINSYRIESPDPDSDLNFAGWSSFSDNGIDAIDADIDGDSIVGNGIGETWDEAGGSDDDVLAESFLLGSSLFSPGRSESLGNAFQVGGAETLMFQYRDAESGAISDGTVVYVDTGLAADVDGDNDVDGADFLIIQRTNPGLIAQWNIEYGSGAPLAAAQAVPEPVSASLLAWAVAMVGCRRRQ